jgi:superfamily I DNA and/or RNA helicase
VDTGSTNAWVTSVVRGGSVSRLNFLSASVCVDLAKQVLRIDRPPLEDGRPRVLIVNPYRPHQKLVELLLKQTTFFGEVVSGTAHSFQGREADVVILDLVVDEPHWRANLFVPDASEDIRRLLNVALTRARRRLLIVADFDWCLDRGKNAFLGRELIPLLLAKYPRVDATEILPNGLALKQAH